jgi:hypothetical protein
MMVLLALPALADVPTGPKPVVVVFPFTGKEGVSPTIGQNISLVVALQLSQAGDVTIKTPPADTAQSDYLRAARALGADYYVAGFLSPIGTQIAVSEQLVSARSGISVWQTTASIAEPQDAADAAMQLHVAIMHLSAQQLPASLASAPTPPPAAPSAAPKTGGALRAGPALTIPVAPPAAVAAAGLPPLPPVPSNRTTAMILPFTGDAIPAILHYVPESLVRTMPQYGWTGTRANVDTPNVSEVGVLLCSQFAADELIGGSLDTGSTDLGEGWGFVVGLDLKVFDCKNLTKKPIDITATAQNGNLQTAVDIAVNQALRGLPNQHTTSMR